MNGLRLQPAQQACLMNQSILTVFVQLAPDLPGSANYRKQEPLINRIIIKFVFKDDLPRKSMNY